MTVRSLPLRTGCALLAAGAALLTAAGPAAAEASPSPSAGTGAAPTEAGTAFRTATAIEQGEPATAVASTGDYLYWVFPASGGQVPAVEATVTLPEASGRHGTQTWRLDVYDGLRRRQPCVYGARTRTVTREQESATLGCTLRAVRDWAEPWSADPLPGAYYVRLTVSGLPGEDLGLPVGIRVTAVSKDAGGDRAGGGSLPAPLNPVLRSGTTGPADAEESADGGDTGEGAEQTAADEPGGGWGEGWWSDRWLWTAGGGVLAALAGVAGHRLARGSVHGT